MRNTLSKTLYPAKLLLATIREIPRFAWHLVFEKTLNRLQRDAWEQGFKYGQASMDPAQAHHRNANPYREIG